MNNTKHQSVIDMLNSLIKACEMGQSGEWDCSSEEGKDKFLYMSEHLKSIKAHMLTRGNNRNIKDKFRTFCAEGGLNSEMSRRLFNWFLPYISEWNEYNFTDKTTRPTKSGKYLIVRKDGKVHWETWNGMGWAYNNDVIIGWMDIAEPNVELLKKAWNEQ
jgi:hypothetical protein